jgi:hypothetical protein
MKYLVVKAWLGFGDRLESLKMAVDFAIKKNLQIYVDWSDSMWSHGNENFYTYFKLINMPVLKSLDDIPEDATVYPEYWKGHIKEPMTLDLTLKVKEHNLDIGVLNKDYPADVVVFSSLGIRTLYPDSSFFAKVFRVIDRRVVSKVNSRKSRFDIPNSWGIHIRGTDRLRPNKRMISIQSIVAHVTTYGGLSGKKMTVVSDDKEQLDIWKRYYPESFVASELSINQTSLAGNHNLAKDALKNSKDEMNVDMLADFFTLALTEMIFTTCKDSRFTQEARRLHPHVNVILGQ